MFRRRPSAILGPLPVRGSVGSTFGKGSDIPATWLRSLLVLCALGTPTISQALILDGSGPASQLTGTFGVVDTVSVADSGTYTAYLTSEGLLSPAPPLLAKRVQYDVLNNLGNGSIFEFRVDFPVGTNVIGAGNPSAFIDSAGNNQNDWAGSNHAMVFDSGFGVYTYDQQFGSEWRIEYAPDHVTWEHLGNGFFADTATGRTDLGNALPTFRLLFDPVTRLGLQPARATGRHSSGAPASASGYVLSAAPTAFETRFSTSVTPVIDVVIDGRFSGNVSDGVVTGEWSLAVPLLFEASSVPPARPIALFADHDINEAIVASGSYVSVVQGLGTAPIADEFYILAAYTGRTTAFARNEIVASVWFPIVNNGALALPPPPGVPVGETFPVGLIVQTDANGDFEYLVDVDGDRRPDGDAAELTIEAVASFGPSHLSDESHLILEFELATFVEPGFGDLNGNGMMDGSEVFPPNGLNGVYPAQPLPWMSCFTADDGTMQFAFNSTISFDELGIVYATILPSDYNNSGIVDAADYVVWRKSDGTQIGYDRWRTNFGRIHSAGSGASANSAVPEPSALALGMLALIVMCCQVITRNRLTVVNPED